VKCPLCGSEKCEKVYQNNNTTFTSKTENFSLVIESCTECGFIYQSSAYETSYDDIVARIYADFDKSASFSFPNRSQENCKTVEFIAKNIDLKSDLNVLEIGSNRGDLLYLIKEQAQNVNILGVEPTKFLSLNVPTINAFFNPGMFSNKFDLVILQHVLEHIKNPVSFVGSLSGLMHEKSVVYIEVPNINESLKNKIEDFMPEHVSYFNLDTLLSLFAEYHPIRVLEDNFIRVLFTNAKIYKSEIAKNNIENLAEMIDDYLQSRQKTIEDVRRIRKTRVIFYGTSFYYRLLFNTLKDCLDMSKCFFIDDNRDGEYEPFNNLKKVDRLSSDDLVIVCSNNFIVQNEIYNKIKNINHNTKVMLPWRGLFE